MNERIKELAEQAGVNLSPFQFSGIPIKYEVTKPVLEKFAELIIKECTQLLFDESERLYAYSNECDIMSRSEDAELCAEKCMDNIKMIEEHFGVEE